MPYRNKEDAKEYRKRNKEHIRVVTREYYQKHRKSIIEWNNKYYQEHKIEKKEDKKIYMKNYNKRLRIKAMNIISNNNLNCVRCGCDDIRLLEINHKNGGGHKESEKGIKSTQYYLSICKGIRKTDDLELLCRVCNSWHYLELKYGKLPYKITYNNIIKGGKNND